MGCQEGKLQFYFGTFIRVSAGREVGEIARHRTGPVLKQSDAGGCQPRGICTPRGCANNAVSRGRQLTNDESLPTTPRN